MASKMTYPCFACKKAGFEVQVFLDGKDKHGRTKYLNEDGTNHTHLGSSSSQQQKQGSTTGVQESTQLKLIGARLEYAISLLEKLQPLETRRIKKDG